MTVIQLAAAPTTTHAYALTGVSPASLTFEAAGSSQALSIEGTDTEMQNGTPTKTTPLTIADVTVTKSAGADWLTVATDGTVTAAENATTEARQATLTIAVTADPSQTKTVAVSQKAGTGEVNEYTFTAVSPAALTFSKYEGSTVDPITISGNVTTKRNGRVIANRPMTIADVLIEKPTSGAEWLTIRDGVISVAANKSGVVRQATLTIKVKEDAATSKTLTVTQRAVNDDNPLAYVANFNILSNGDWDTNHTIPSSSNDRNVLMNWSTAKSKYGSARSIQGSTETYKLPSVEAWQGIIAYTSSSLTFVSGSVQYNRIAEVEVAGQKFNSTGDYKPTTMTVNGSSVKCTVALRFKGDDPTEKQYRSAWLYYWGTNAVNGKSVPGLWIYCVNISGRQGISTVDNLDQKFWDQSLSSAVVRFFPAAGASFGRQGTYGYYWSATDYSSSTYTMLFNSSDVTVNGYSRTSAWAVRLFASAPLD